MALDVEGWNGSLFALKYTMKLALRQNFSPPSPRIIEGRGMWILREGIWFVGFPKMEVIPLVVSSSTI